MDRGDVRRWGALWGLSDFTEAEQFAGFDRLAGPGADKLRREGFAMLEAAIRGAGGSEADVATFREIMVGPPREWLDNTGLEPRANAWRRLQVRQLFRLSLEAMFYWLLKQLVGCPLTSEQLAALFLQDAGLSEKMSTANWLAGAQQVNPAASRRTG